MALINHPDIAGATLFIAPPGPHTHEPHAHDSYSVIVLTEGRKDFQHETHTHRVAAPQIALANPEELHGCGPVDGEDWSHSTWYLTQDLAAQIGGGETPRLASPVVDDVEVANALNTAHEAARTSESALERESLAWEALLLLFDRHSANGPPSRREGLSDGVSVRMATYMVLASDRLSESLRVEDFANAAGVSRAQVVRDFGRELGVSPSGYIRHKRAEHAKRLIAEGGSLAEAAYSSGFADQAHMSRVIRKLYGVRPSQLQGVADGLSRL